MGCGGLFICRAIYGYDYVTSCYKEEPAESWNRLVEYMHEAYPIATDKQIRKSLR